jgi:hypothetical protein
VFVLGRIIEPTSKLDTIRDPGPNWGVFPVKGDVAPLPAARGRTGQDTTATTGNLRVDASFLAQPTLRSPSSRGVSKYRVVTS